MGGGASSNTRCQRPVSYPQPHKIEYSSQPAIGYPIQPQQIIYPNQQPMIYPYQNQPMMYNSGPQQMT